MYVAHFLVWVINCQVARYMHQYILCYRSPRYDGRVKSKHEGELTRASVILKYCAYFDNAFILTLCLCLYCRLNR